MASFAFVCCVSLSYETLRYTDFLSKSLQQRKMSASEGQYLAKLTVTTHQKLRSNKTYEDFWEKLDRTLDTVGVSEPALPQWRKAPKRFDTGSAPYDLVINCIQDRFDQPGFHVYKNLQDVILCGITGDSETTDALNFEVTFYKNDIDETTYRLN